MTPLKLPIKYGLLITIGVAAWVLIAHTLVTDRTSLVHRFGSPILFNILHFTMIYLGVKALERKKGESLPFKEGLKTGVWISFFYLLTLSIFFAGLMIFVGTRWLESGPTTGESMTIVAAFAMLFFGGMFLGLIYSTLISFFLAKRQSADYAD